MNPDQLLNAADLIYSKADVDLAITRLAVEITQELQGRAPLILTVMNGGLYFAGQLLPQLKFSLETYYVHATRYDGETAGKEITWRAPPTDHVRGRVILLLDDILDEGHTLAAIRDKCLSLGAVDVKIAVLTEKLLEHTKPIQADYIGLTLPNRYVFGCGMDVYGWWRNLPEIRALKAL